MPERNIYEVSLAGLEEILARWKEQKFHARQIFSWLYQKGAETFDQMSDLSQGLRKQLKENFSLSSLKLIRTLKSADGTEKFLFSLADGNSIEAVIIPAEKRITACVSTQVGCKFACRFCASGLAGFKRNLASGEIVAEVLALERYAPAKKLTHLVFMGTGEP
jgi:23S rRNA (adenine2503-C2)-methyltransferase